MNIRHELEKELGIHPDIQLNNIELDPLSIHALLINEVVPTDPMQDFYGYADADYLTTTFALFEAAGFPITDVQQLLERGIYITNAVKTPKVSTSISNDELNRSLPYLEKEIALFPNLKVIRLMGDVAKKAFNKIAKKTTGKNAVPAISTYKLRNSVLTYQNIRILPSYIMTGGNLLIEKSKMTMAAEDIARMLDLIPSRD